MGSRAALARGIAYGSAALFSLAYDFGAHTACTNEYSCTTTWCTPSCERVLWTGQLAAAALVGLLGLAWWVGRRRGDGAPWPIDAAAVVVASVALLSMSHW